MDTWQNKTTYDYAYGMIDWRKRYRFWFRAMAFTLIFTFVLYDITWAQGGTPIWENARPDIKTSTKLQLDRINIPQGAGSTQDAYSNGGNDVIINIQDAHASLSAQNSIVQLLDTLSNNYDLNVIALEGAEGPIDTSFLHSLPDPEVRKDTAEYLMREGRMSAGEFFSVTSAQNVKLYGIEDNDLYQANLESFRKIMAKNSECIKNTESLGRALALLEPKIYSKDLLEFNEKAGLHRDKKLSFAEYWDFVLKFAKRHNIELTAFDNISKLLKTVELEKTIDFAKANDERKNLVDELTRVLPKNEIEKLILQSLAFKKGTVSKSEFHTYLVNLAKDAKLSPQAYPNLIRFTNYINTYEDIDVVRIFEEVDSVEGYIRERIFRNDDERTLQNLAAAAGMMKKLFQVSLTNGDYNFFTTKKRYLDRMLINDFIKENYMKYNLDFNHTYDLDVIFEGMKEAINFYEVAQKRNNVMLANTISAMRKNGEHVAALITGGYHSKGLSELMKEKGLSYLVIMPKFDAGKERPYIAILTNKKQPYEELLESGEYTIAAEAYFNQGDEKKFREAQHYSVAMKFLRTSGLQFDKNISARPFLKTWLQDFTREYYEWKGQKRPISPDILAKAWGFKTPKPVFKQNGSIESVEVESVNIEEDKDSKADFMVGAVEVGGRKSIIVQHTFSNGVSAAVEFIQDTEGKWKPGAVRPEAQRAFNERNEQKRHKADKDLGKKITEVLHEDNIALITDDIVARNKAGLGNLPYDEKLRARIVGRAVERIKGRIGMHIDRRISNAEKLELFIAAARAAGLDISLAVIDKNENFKRLILSEINANLPKVVSEAPQPKELPTVSVKIEAVPVAKIQPAGPVPAPGITEPASEIKKQNPGQERKGSLYFHPLFLLTLIIGAIISTAAGHYQRYGELPINEILSNPSYLGPIGFIAGIFGLWLCIFPQDWRIYKDTHQRQVELAQSVLINKNYEKDNGLAVNSLINAATHSSHKDIRRRALITLEKLNGRKYTNGEVRKELFRRSKDSDKTIRKDAERVLEKLGWLENGTFLTFFILTMVGIFLVAMSGCAQGPQNASGLVNYGGLFLIITGFVIGVASLLLIAKGSNKTADLHSIGSAEMEKDGMVDDLWQNLAPDNRARCEEVAEMIEKKYAGSIVILGSASRIDNVVMRWLQERANLIGGAEYENCVSTVRHALDNLDQYGSGNGALLLRIQPTENDNTDISLILLDRGDGFVTSDGTHRPIHEAVKDGISLSREDGDGFGLFKIKEFANSFMSITTADKTGAYYWDKGLGKEVRLDTVPGRNGTKIVCVRETNHGSGYIGGYEPVPGKPPAYNPADNKLRGQLRRIRVKAKGQEEIVDLSKVENVRLRTKEEIKSILEGIKNGKYDLDPFIYEIIAAFDNFKGDVVTFRYPESSFTNPDDHIVSFGANNLIGISDSLFDNIKAGPLTVLHELGHAVIDSRAGQKLLKRIVVHLKPSMLSDEARGMLEKAMQTTNYQQKVHYVLRALYRYALETEDITLSEVITAVKEEAQASIDWVAKNRRSQNNMFNGVEISRVRIDNTYLSAASIRRPAWEQLKKSPEDMQNLIRVIGADINELRNSGLLAMQNSSGKRIIAIGDEVRGIVYVRLNNSILVDNNKITMLKIEGALPRKKNGRIASYDAGELTRRFGIAFDLNNDEPSLTMTGSRQEPEGAMLAGMAEEEAGILLDCVPKRDEDKILVDSYIGHGIYAGSPFSQKTEESPRDTGYLITGLANWNSDEDFYLSPRSEEAGDNSMGIKNLELPGEVSNINRMVDGTDRAKLLYKTLGEHLRIYHDKGYRHGFPSIRMDNESIGVRRIVDGFVPVLRHLTGGLNNEADSPRISGNFKHRAAQRFLDMAVIISEAVKSGYEDCVGPFLTGYFDGPELRDKKYEAMELSAVSELVNGMDFIEFGENGAYLLLTENNVYFGKLIHILRALEMLHEIPDDAKGTTTAFYRKGMAYLDARQYFKAIEAFEKVAATYREMAESSQEFMLESLALLNLTRKNINNIHNLSIANYLDKNIDINKHREYERKCEAANKSINEAVFLMKKLRAESRQSTKGFLARLIPLKIVVAVAIAALIAGGIFCAPAIVKAIMEWWESLGSNGPPLRTQAKYMAVFLPVAMAWLGKIFGKEDNSRPMTDAEKEKMRETQERLKKEAEKARNAEQTRIIGTGLPVVNIPPKTTETPVKPKQNVEVKKAPAVSLPKIFGRSESVTLFGEIEAKRAEYAEISFDDEGVEYLGYFKGGKEMDWKDFPGGKEAADETINTFINAVKNLKHPYKKENAEGGSVDVPKKIYIIFKLPGVSKDGKRSLQIDDQGFFQVNKVATYATRVPDSNITVISAVAFKDHARLYEALAHLSVISEGNRGTQHLAGLDRQRHIAAVALRKDPSLQDKKRPYHIEEIHDIECRRIDSEKERVFDFPASSDNEADYSPSWQFESVTKGKGEKKPGPSNDGLGKLGPALTLLVAAFLVLPSIAWKSRDAQPVFATIPVSCVSIAIAIIFTLPLVMYLIHFLYKMLHYISNISRGGDVQSSIIDLSEMGPAVKIAAPILAKKLEDTSSSIRIAASNVLKDLGCLTEERKVRLYIADLNDRSYERGHADAIEALGQIGSAAKAAIPALMEHDSAAAVEAAYKIDPSTPGIIYALILKTDNTEAVVKIGKRAVPDLIKALSSDSPHGRRHAARILGEIGPDAKEAISELECELFDPKNFVRAAAFDSLEKLGCLTNELKIRRYRMDVLQHYEQLYQEGRYYDEAIMVPAIEALIDIGEPALSVLIEASGHEKYVVRQKTFEALEKAGLLTAEAKIKKYVADILDINELYRNRPHEQEGIEGLKKIGKSGLSLLIEKLRNEYLDVSVRKAVIYAIAEIGPDAKEAAPELAGLLDHKKFIREAALTALEKLGCLTEELKSKALMAELDDLKKQTYVSSSLPPPEPLVTWDDCEDNIDPDIARQRAEDDQRDKITRILREEGLGSGYLHGSRARGTARGDSDYDISIPGSQFIHPRQAEQDERVRRAAERISEITGQKTDISFDTQSGIDRKDGKPLGFTLILILTAKIMLGFALVKIVFPFATDVKHAGFSETLQSWLAATGISGSLPWVAIGILAIAAVTFNIIIASKKSDSTRTFFFNLFKLSIIPVVSITLSAALGNFYIWFISPLSLGSVFDVPIGKVIGTAIVGAVALGGGNLSQQAVSGKDINWSKAGLWALVGTALSGLFTYGIVFPQMSSWTANKSFSEIRFVLIDLIFYAPLVFIPIELYMNTRISPEDVPHGFWPHFKLWWAVVWRNFIWFLPALSAGMALWPEKVALVDANAAIIWAGFLFYLLRGKPEHEKIMKPFNEERAKDREKLLDPKEVMVGQGEIQKFIDGLIASGKKFVVVTSPQAREQMEKWNFPHKYELLAKSVNVAEVHYKYLDGRAGNYFEKVRGIEKDPELIIGIGMGSVTDWAKMMGYKFSADVVIIPSALSTNAPFTSNVVIRDEGRKRTSFGHYSWPAGAAKSVIVDLDFVRLNPRANLSGAGDLLSSWIALNDWILAVCKGAERKDEDVFRNTKTLLDNLYKFRRFFRSSNKKGQAKGLEVLAYMNSETSKLMTVFGTGRPKAGSEHILADTLEGIVRNRRRPDGGRILHGELVAVSTLLMMYLYSKIDLRRLAKESGANIPPRDLENVHIAANKLVNMYKEIGINLDLAQIGITREDLIEALTGAKKRPKRYSYLDVYKISDELAREAVDSVFPSSARAPKSSEDSKPYISIPTGLPKELTDRSDAVWNDVQRTERWLERLVAEKEARMKQMQNPPPTFRPRDSFWYGVMFKIVSFCALAYMTVSAMSPQNSMPERIAFAMGAIYFIVQLVTTFAFIWYGISINSKINKMTLGRKSVFNDDRIVATPGGFDKEIEKVLYADEKSFVNFHEGIHRYVRNDSMAWAIGYLIAPFILVPSMVISASKLMSISNKDGGEIVPADIKTRAEMEYAFKMCKIEAEELLRDDPYLRDKINGETREVKDALFALIVMYKMLNRGWPLNKNESTGTAVGEFLEEWGVDNLRILYIGKEENTGNIGRVVDRIAERKQLTTGQREHIVELCTMALASQYVNRGSLALITQGRYAKKIVNWITITHKILFVASAALIAAGLSIGSASTANLGILSAIVSLGGMIFIKVVGAMSDLPIRKWGREVIEKAHKSDKHDPEEFAVLLEKLRNARMGRKEKMAAIRNLFEIARTEAELTEVFGYVREELDKTEDKFAANKLWQEILQIRYNVENLPLNKAFFAEYIRYAEAFIISEKGINLPIDVFIETLDMLYSLDKAWFKDYIGTRFMAAFTQAREREIKYYLDKFAKDPELRDVAGRLVLPLTEPAVIIQENKGIFGISYTYNGKTISLGIVKKLDAIRAAVSKNTVTLLLAVFLVVTSIGWPVLAGLLGTTVVAIASNFNYRREPDAASEYYISGNIFMESGKYETAIDCYTKAIELEPSFVLAYTGRGTAFSRLEQFEEAIKNYNKAISINPRFSEIYYNRGVVYMKQEKPGEAIVDFTKVIEIDPGYASAYVNRGVAYMMLGQREKAIDDYSTAISVDQGYALAYYNRGNALLDLGRKKEAEKDLGMAARLNYSLRGYIIQIAHEFGLNLGLDDLSGPPSSHLWALLISIGMGIIIASAYSVFAGTFTGPTSTDALPLIKAGAAFLGVSLIPVVKKSGAEQIDEDNILEITGSSWQYRLKNNGKVNDIAKAALKEAVSSEMPENVKKSIASSLIQSSLSEVCLVPDAMLGGRRFWISPDTGSLYFDKDAFKIMSGEDIIEILDIADSAVTSDNIGAANDKENDWVAKPRADQKRKEEKAHAAKILQEQAKQKVPVTEKPEKPEVKKPTIVNGEKLLKSRLGNYVHQVFTGSDVENQIAIRYGGFTGDTVFIDIDKPDFVKPDFNIITVYDWWQGIPKPRLIVIPEPRFIESSLTRYSVSIAKDEERQRAWKANPHIEPVLQLFDSINKNWDTDTNKEKMIKFAEIIRTLKQTLEVKYGSSDAVIAKIENTKELYPHIADDIEKAQKFVTELVEAEHATDRVIDETFYHISEFARDGMIPSDIMKKALDKVMPLTARWPRIYAAFQMFTRNFYTKGQPISVEDVISIVTELVKTIREHRVSVLSESGLNPQALEIVYYDAERLALLHILNDERNGLLARAEQMVASGEEASPAIISETSDTFGKVSELIYNEVVTDMIKEKARTAPSGNIRPSTFMGGVGMLFVKKASGNNNSYTVQRYIQGGAVTSPIRYNTKYQPQQIKASYEESDGIIFLYPVHGNTANLEQLKMFIEQVFELWRSGLGLSEVFIGAVDEDGNIYCRRLNIPWGDMTKWYEALAVVTNASDIYVEHIKRSLFAKILTGTKNGAFQLNKATEKADGVKRTVLTKNFRSTTNNRVRNILQIVKAGLLECGYDDDTAAAIIKNVEKRMGRDFNKIRSFDIMTDTRQRIYTDYDALENQMPYLVNKVIAITAEEMGDVVFNNLSLFTPVSVENLTKKDEDGRKAEERSRAKAMQRIFNQRLKSIGQIDLSNSEEVRRSRKDAEELLLEGDLDESQASSVKNILENKLEKEFLELFMADVEKVFREFLGGGDAGSVYKVYKRKELAEETVAEPQLSAVYNAGIRQAIAKLIVIDQYIGAKEAVQYLLALEGLTREDAEEFCNMIVGSMDNVSGLDPDSQERVRALFSENLRLLKDEFVTQTRQELNAAFSDGKGMDELDEETQTRLLLRLDVTCRLLGQQRSVEKMEFEQARLKLQNIVEEQSIYRAIDIMQDSKGGIQKGKADKDIVVNIGDSFRCYNRYTGRAVTATLTKIDRGMAYFNVVTPLGMVAVGGNEIAAFAFNNHDEWRSGRVKIRMAEHDRVAAGKLYVDPDNFDPARVETRLVKDERDYGVSNRFWIFPAPVLKAVIDDPMVVVGRRSNKNEIAFKDIVTGLSIKMAVAQSSERSARLTLEDPLDQYDYDKIEIIAAQKSTIAGRNGVNRGMITLETTITVIMILAVFLPLVIIPLARDLHDLGFGLALSSWWKTAWPTGIISFITAAIVTAFGFAFHVFYTRLAPAVPDTPRSKQLFGLRYEHDLLMYAIEWPLILGLVYGLWAYRGVTLAAIAAICVTGIVYSSYEDHIRYKTMFENEAKIIESGRLNNDSINWFIEELGENSFTYGRFIIDTFQKHERVAGLVMNRLAEEVIDPNAAEFRNRSVEVNAQKELSYLLNNETLRKMFATKVMKGFNDSQQQLLQKIVDDKVRSIKRVKIIKMSIAGSFVAFVAYSIGALPAAAIITAGFLVFMLKRWLTAHQNITPLTPAAQKILVGVPRSRAMTQDEEAAIRKTLESAQTKIPEKIEVIFFNDMGERGNLAYVSEYAKMHGAIVGLPLRGGMSADELAEALNAGLMEKISNDLFRLINPDLNSLDESRARLLNMTLEEKKAIEKRLESTLPLIASETLAVSSLYSMNLRARNINSRYAIAHPKDAALANEDQDNKLKICIVRSAAEIKPLAEAHRGKIGSLKIALIPTEEEMKKGINKEELLKLEEVDDVLKPDDVIIVKASTTLAEIRSEFSAAFRRDNKGREPKKIAIADLFNQDRPETDVPDDLIFLEYEGVAGPHVYYALCEALAKPDDRNHIAIEQGRRKGWFRIIQKIDLEQLRHEIEQYEKVLMSA